MIATQLPLFETVPEKVRSARVAPRPRARRDPAEVESVGRRDRLGSDLRSAFVSFWGRLSPEQRAELRARLAA